MNHTELVDAVAERSNLSKAATKDLVEAVFAVVRDTLARGEEVRVSGFGTFGVSERAAREGRNPRTGETIKIPASKVAKFSPSKAVKDALNG